MSAGFTPGPWEAQRSIVHVEGKGNLATVENPWNNEMERIANARLIAAAPDYGTACGLDLHPGEAQSCGPLAWLRSAIDTLSEDAVREAAQGDDPDAYFTMVTECRLLAERLEAANAKVRGDQ